MSMSDPLADMLVQIRNAQQCGKAEVTLPYSRMKHRISKVLEQEGYLGRVEQGYVSGNSVLTLGLKYHNGRRVIDMIQRVSKPGKRVYKSSQNIPYVMGGLGIAVISTSSGVMSDREARAKGVGGEVVCLVA